MRIPRKLTGTVGVLAAIAVAGGVGGPPAYRVITGGGGGGGGGTFPNDTAANVFLSQTGSDAGANCKRFSPATSSVPTASTACATAAKAYTLASAGDTVWVLPGTYPDASTSDSFPSGTAPTSKTVTNANNCNSTHQCVYIEPQPGQATNVISGGRFQFNQNSTPSHLYYKGFIRNACLDFKYQTFNTSTGFPTDTTIDGFKALRADGDCQPFMAGPWHYVHITNGQFEHGCTTGGVSGGFGIQANGAGSGGETSDHTFAPDNLLIDHNIFSHYNINCLPTDHQDCIHVYAMYNSAINSNTFYDCYDSSILAEGIDEAGFQENDSIINNWFGPTILGTNNCCLRGDNSAPSSETFDSWTIAFNSSTSVFMNKTGNVLNNVSFIGNIGLSSQTCQLTGANGSTNVTWAYNIMGGSACAGTGNLGGQTNTNIKWTSITSPPDMHIGAGSVAIGFVPSSSGYCNALTGNVDHNNQTRAATCAAGANEP